MKYCTKCGHELLDEAVICPNCGCAVEGTNYSAPAAAPAAPASGDSTLKMIAKIFMVIGCIATAFAIIPLFWTVPMTISYFNKVSRGEPVSTGFKVCALIFVNLIAGILMLCDNT